MNEQIRTIQAEELVNRTQEIASLASLKYSIPIDEIPMLIMGDFNSDTHGEGGTCIRSILERNWTSVYPTEPESSKSLFSTWKIRGDHSARRVIDYMFYNAKNVRDFTCTNILLPPDDSDIEPGKLPGMRYPSDHIALGARFAINHTTVSK
jgi:mRNA deadenylase 3'-5' endonuclease subunit Ccr4